MNCESSFKIKRKNDTVTQNCDKDTNKTSTWTVEEEDEVICTPDVLSLMEEEESPEKEDHKNAPPGQPYLRVKLFAKEQEQLQTNNQEHPYAKTPLEHVYRPLLPATLQFQQPIPAQTLNIVNRPPLLTYQSATHRPLFFQSFPIGQTQPAQIAPLRVLAPVQLITPNESNNFSDWFDKAAQQAASVNCHLTSKLVELSKEQKAAESVEQMAFVHNKLQELLSSTVNALIQVRKKLRTDFLNDLQKMKFPRSLNKANSSQAVISDNLVPKVNNVSESIPSVSSPILQSTLSNNVTKPRLKVKTLDELLSVPSEYIVIPDTPPPLVKLNNTRNENHVSSSNMEITNQNLESNLENIHNKSTTQVTDKACNDETAFLVKQALNDSLFEYTFAENSKCIVKDISNEEFRKMLSVRVCLEKKFSSGTPKTNPKKGFVPFELKPPLVMKIQVNNDNTFKVNGNEMSNGSVFNKSIDNEAISNDNTVDNRETHEGDQITTDSGIEVDTLN